MSGGTERLRKLVKKLSRLATYAHHVGADVDPDSLMKIVKELEAALADSPAKEIRNVLEVPSSIHTNDTVRNNLPVGESQKVSAALAPSSEARNPSDKLLEELRAIADEECGLYEIDGINTWRMVERIVERTLAEMPPTPTGVHFTKKEHL